MSGTDGKVALCNSTTALTTTTSSGSQIVDFVGYGGATTYEGGGAATSPSNTVSIARKNGGQDTDDNANDFATSSPHPENSANALPVELASFAVSADKNQVKLHWTTATEVNNFGFDVERKLGSGGERFQKIGFVQGAGTSATPRQYGYVDRNVRPGSYIYRTKQIDRNGTFNYSADVQVTVIGVPRVLALNQNYPNPFNPSTNIEFSVPKDGKAILKVHNLIGQEIATLFDGDATAGELVKVTFDASRLTSGVYFSRLESGGHVLVNRMLLMK